MPHGQRATHEDLLLQSVPHGQRATHEDLLLQSVPHGSRAMHEDRVLQGLPHGEAMPYQTRPLHCLQACLLHQDDYGPTSRMQESALYGHEMRTACDLQKGSGHGLLP